MCRGSGWTDESGKLIAQHVTGATPALDLAPFRYERPEIADAVEDFGQW